MTYFVSRAIEDATRRWKQDVGAPCVPTVLMLEKCRSSRWIGTCLSAPPTACLACARNVFVITETAESLTPVHESVARPPLLFLAHILRSRTCTIGSPVAPVVSPTDWLAARALHAAPRPAPQPPCAHTALQATGRSTPDGVHAGLQTCRLRKQGSASSTFQTCTLVHDAKSMCAPSCVLSLACPWSNLRPCARMRASCLLQSASVIRKNLRPNALCR